MAHYQESYHPPHLYNDMAEILKDHPFILAMLFEKDTFFEQQPYEEVLEFCKKLLPYFCGFTTLDKYLFPRLDSTEKYKEVFGLCLDSKQHRRKLLQAYEAFLCGEKQNFEGLACVPQQIADIADDGCAALTIEVEKMRWQDRSEEFFKKLCSSIQTDEHFLTALRYYEDKERIQRLMNAWYENVYGPKEVTEIQEDVFVSKELRFSVDPSADFKWSHCEEDKERLIKIINSTDHEVIRLAVAFLLKERHAESCFLHPNEESRKINQ